MERKHLLEIAGYTLDTTWGCEWDKTKDALPNKVTPKDIADKHNMEPGHALFWR